MLICIEVYTLLAWLASLQQTVNHVQNGKIPAFSVQGLNTKEAVVCSVFWALVLQLWLFFFNKRMQETKTDWKSKSKRNVFSKYCPVSAPIFIFSNNVISLKKIKSKISILSTLDVLNESSVCGLCFLPSSLSLPCQSCKSPVHNS